MRTFSEIIDAFGVPVVAEVLSLPESHVRTMKARDSIAPEYWEALIEAAPKHGVRGLDYKRLHKIRAERFPRSAQSPERMAC